MIRSCIFAAAAAIVLAAPIAASAAPQTDPAFDAFRKYCGDTGADFTAAVKAADADGWKDTQVIADTLPGVSVTQKAARTTGAGPDALRLLITSGLRSTKSGDIVVSTCTVSSDTAVPGLLGRAQAWLNMATMSADTDKASYLLTMNGGTRTLLATGDIDAAVGKGGAHLLKFKEDANSEILDYERFSK
jgi:hypothetical protein